MEIPRGNSREDTKARRQIIKDFYNNWFSANPDQVVRNKALHADIHVKYSSMNETSGRVYKMKYGKYKLVVGLQKSTGHLVQYYVGGGDKK